MITMFSTDPDIDKYKTDTAGKNFSGEFLEEINFNNDIANLV